MQGFSEITSKDNPLIKLVCALQTSASARKKQGLFVLEGLRICKDAEENAIGFDKLIVSKTAMEKYSRDIAVFAKNSCDCISVPDSLFKKMSDTDSPQGIIAVAHFPEKKSDIDPCGRYVALENISDPSNLGAVARTAEALGVSGIVLSASGCDPYSPKALRASMGTLLRMPLYITDDIISFARLHGLRALACVVDSDAKPLGDVEFCGGDVVMIGNEANGLSDSAKALADMRITVPMAGRAESLNAAAAAAIVMWEMVG